jgi:D-methionine transport system permease protein
MYTELLLALLETLLMVFASGLIACLLGLPIGVLLSVTRKNQIWENPPFHYMLAGLVNATRSVPFIILMIAITPLTRLIVGSSIGVLATLVPLSLAAIPFFARTVETALEEVPDRLIETGLSMGATQMQIIRKILIPEASAGILSGVTLTLVSLVGYSAMAGAIGGGGLGTLAFHHGYQRFDTSIMVTTVIILILVVQLIQMAGDYAVSKFQH